MTTMNLKEARKQLGHLVDAVTKGESVTITRRGRKVARLVPVEGKRRRGLPDLTAFRASLHPKGRTLTAELLALRREGRY